MACPQSGEGGGWGGGIKYRGALAQRGKLPEENAHPSVHVKRM
jgi:hypothetical protein